MVKGSNTPTHPSKCSLGKNYGDYLKRKISTKRPSQQKKAQKAKEQARKVRDAVAKMPSGLYKNMLTTMMNTSKHVIHDKINEPKTNESKTKQGGKRKTHKKRKSHKKRRKTHKKRKSHKKHRK